MQCKAGRDFTVNQIHQSENVNKFQITLKHGQHNSTVPTAVSKEEDEVYDTLITLVSYKFLFHHFRIFFGVLASDVPVTDICY